MREVPDAVGRSDFGGRYDAGLGPDTGGLSDAEGGPDAGLGPDAGGGLLLD